MKIKSSFFALLVAVAALSSCGKEDPVSADLSTRATITGLVRGNIDFTNDFITQEIEVEGEIVVDTIPTVVFEPLEGVRIFARFSTADLTTVNQPGYPYPAQIVEATTNADGRYTLTIPAGTKTVGVTVDGNDFEVDLILEDNQTERVIMGTNAATVNVTQNETRVVDFTYSIN
ncbi:MAG: hypothetical protein ABR572_07200 [Cryomorphaceae bacterium]